MAGFSVSELWGRTLQFYRPPAPSSQRRLLFAPVRRLAKISAWSEDSVATEGASFEIFASAPFCHGLSRFDIRQAAMPYFHLLLHDAPAISEFASPLSLIGNRRSKACECICLSAA